MNFDRISLFDALCTLDNVCVRVFDCACLFDRVRISNCSQAYARTVTGVEAARPGRYLSLAATVTRAPGQQRRTGRARA